MRVNKKRLSLTIIVLCLIIGGVVVYATGVLDKDKDKVSGTKTTEKKEVNYAFNGKLTEFVSTDIYSDIAVSDDLIKNNEMTMVHIWGTYSPPSKESLPVIETLYQDIKSKQISVFGIVIDTKSSKNVDAAYSLSEEHTLSFVNVRINEELKDWIESQKYENVPTTLFVDSNYNIIGEPIVGLKTESFYKKEADARLSWLKKQSQK